MFSIYFFLRTRLSFALYLFRSLRVFALSFSTSFAAFLRPRFFAGPRPSFSSSSSKFSSVLDLGRRSADEG
jgi:hypothetical protein